MFTKINKFINEHAYLLSTVLIIGALLLDITFYIGETIHEGFSSVNLFFLFFEVILHVGMVCGLLLKNTRLFNMLMVSIKAFDAIFFSFIIGKRLDSIYKGTLPSGMHDYVNLVSYALSAICLLAILLFFVLNGATGKHIYWKIMKILILITIGTMLVCSIFEIVNFFSKDLAFWFTFLEPFYMVFLLSGVFIICHYVEKDK